MLKKSIPYSQALRKKIICSTKKNIGITQEKWRNERETFKQGYDQKLLDELLEKFDKLVNNNSLVSKRHQYPKCVPLILTYNEFLPKPYSGFSKKLKHPPSQQKYTSINPRKANQKKQPSREIKI